MTRQPGQKVTVINSTMSGVYFIEGTATVLKHLDDDRYLVRFGGNAEMSVERYVDPRAQALPAEYVAELNNQRSALDC